MPTSKIHWTKTPAGKRKLSRIVKARWAKERAAKAHSESPQVRQQKKRFKRKKATITVSDTRFLQNALAEATTEIEKRVRESLAREARSSSFLWTTALGAQIAPQDMDEGHLRNTISFLQRRLVAAFGKVTWLNTTHDMIKALDAMLDEAKRRNLRV